MSFDLNKLVQPECGAANPLVAAAQQITMKVPTTSRFSHQQQAPINFAKEFIQQTKQEINASTTTGQFNSHRPSILSQSNLMYQNTQSVHIPQAGTSSMNLSGKLATDFLAEQELSEGVERLKVKPPIVGSSLMELNNISYMMNGRSSSLASSMVQSGIHLHQQQHQQQQDNSTSAGDQLETKYRNDMISQSKSISGKTDDMEFWQNLAQQYIAPTTYDNILRANLNKTTTEKMKTFEKNEELNKQQTTEEVDNDFEGASQRVLRSLSDTEYTFDERNPLKDQFEDPFAEGIKRLEQGDIPSAALLFEAAVQKEPENSVAWRYLGTTQAQNERDLSAIRALKNCLKLDNNDQQARRAISVSLVNETQHSEACRYLLEWLMSHEKYKILGASLVEFHQFDEELSDDPFYINAVDQKHYKYVREKFVEAARMSPQNPDPDVQDSLGILFNMQGDYDKAVDCYKAALSVKSNDSLLWNRLGATLANGNKPEDAVVAYRKALEISPGFLRSRYNLAISLTHLTLYEEATRQLVQILNMQAAGRGSKNAQIRTRSITSSSIWNTLRTVATLQNKPELYPMIDGRDLNRCNEEIFKSNSSIPVTSTTPASVLAPTTTASASASTAQPNNDTN